MTLNIWNKEDREEMLSVAEFVCQSPVIQPEFRGNAAHVMPVINQANKWGMDPYTVVENAYILKKIDKKAGTETWTIAYSSHLIIAAVNATAPIQGRMTYEYKGPWENIVGNTKIAKNKWGKDVVTPAWTSEDERKVSIVIRAITNEGQELSHEVFLAQAGVRQSSIWATNPKLQFSYVAAKEFSRLYFPDVIMGVYSKEELSEPEINVVSEEEKIKLNDDQAKMLLEEMKAKKEDDLLLGNDLDIDDPL